VSEKSPETFPEDDLEAEDNNNRTLIILGIAVVAFIACAAAALFFLVIRDTGSGGTATDEATAPPGASATAQIPEGAPDPVWAKIQQSGTMVVGTSADYPPFEFYTPGFQLDGFDIALIRDIGQKLGLQVDIKDMAFDGLGGALQVNQIDLAISGITVTDQREGFIDFSNTYFLSEDVLLTFEGSQISVSAIDQVAAYRLGVQSGSIYENAARTQLIETGLMPESRLFVYTQMDRALTDLAERRIDLVAMDRAPADTAIQQGGYVLAGEGLNAQQIAMAIPQDAFILRDEINRTLAELQAEGRVAELIEEYFNVDPGTLPPIPTPDPGQPTPTPLPPAGCIDAMQWVADLSYDDQNFTNIPEVPGGTSFQKGWRLRNTGTCTWDNSYFFVPVDGNDPAARMGGVPTPVGTQVAPGQTYDMWVDLTAPLHPGTYVEYWTMRSPSGILFGDRVWVAITVPTGPTATPPPTQTPSADVRFSANPETIQEGEFQAVYLYPQGEPWQNHGVPGNGTRTVCPSDTTTYELRVVKLDGSVEIRTATVHVMPNPDSPEITRFTVEPPYQINLGQCVLITWMVEGNVSSVNITRNDVTIWPNAPFSGNMQDCPQSAGEFVYGILAEGPGGTSRATHAIQVVTQSTPTPTQEPSQPTFTPLPPTVPPPTPTPIPDPIIYSFSATPSQVETGHCVTVAWSVGGSTNQIQILKNGAIVVDDAAFRDSVQDCNLEQAGVVTYEIRATNNSGGSATDQATVNVVESAPDNPLADTQWQLVSYLVGSEVTPVLENSVVSIAFQADGVYAGFGGCNSYGGDYMVNGSQITISAPTTSRKSCEGELTQQEITYLTLLPTAATYQFVNDQLTIADNTGAIILTYAAIVATPLPG
jgi:polar amino acid transport system substrate-binding protein